MKTLLWLDDTRDCFDLEANWLVFSPFELLEGDEVIWVKSYSEFRDYLENWGVPDGVCFDHDLHFKHYGILQEDWKNYYEKERDFEEFTGYEAALFLTAYCLDHQTPLPQWNCQSANIIGKENINSVLNSFLKYQNEKVC
jgi:hypothetical protein